MAMQEIGSLQSGREAIRASSRILEVNVNKACEVDQALEDAISEITEAAVLHKTGVMVTRVGPGRYIVRAHPAVPFGLIRQRHG